MTFCCCKHYPLQGAITITRFTTRFQMKLEFLSNQSFASSIVGCKSGLSYDVKLHIIKTFALYRVSKKSKISHLFREIIISNALYAC